MHEVDGVAAALAAQGARVGGRGGAVAGDVGLGEEHEAAAGRHALREAAAGDGDQAGLRRGGQLLDELGGHLRVVQLLDGALRGAGTGDDQRGRAARGDVPAQVGQRPVGVAPVRLDLVHRRREDPVVFLVAARHQRAQRDDRVPGRRGVAEHVVEAAVGAGAHVDRGVAADPRGEPARLEELLTRADEVRRARADALGIGEQHRRAGRQQVREQLELGPDQRRDQRLHALGGDALGQVLQQLAQRRVVLVGAGEHRGPAPHLGGEQQFATAGGVQLVDGGDGALVGHGEAAQLADLVAPELDAHGVLGGGREDVDDPAADGELAAGGDHLHPRVGQLDEADQQVVEVVGVADPQADRLQPAQAGRDRLDQAAGGRHDQPGRGGGVGQPAEDRQPAADGVRARREPLVRQGLPARQHGDDVATEQVRGGGGEVVGLAVGRGDGEDRPALGEAGGQEGPQCRGTLDGQRRHTRGPHVAGCGGQCAEFGVRGGEQTGELGHDSPCSRHAGQTPARDGWGSTPRLRGRSPTGPDARGHRHRTETRRARGGNTAVLHCSRLTNR